MASTVEQRDFFISFTSADLAYAGAMDAALRTAGFTTFYHPNDLPAGGNIAIWMDDGLTNAAQTLALYSPDYVSDKAIYSKAERYASWWQDPVSDKRKLIPIIIRETKLSPLIAPIKHINVAGMRPDEAGAQVVKQLKTATEAQERQRWRVGLPLPTIFRASYRSNPNFTGRFEAMDSLQQSLSTRSKAAITAIAGMGGIGKTTLASEYCHRFGGLYGGVWWMRAEQEPVMLGDLQALGVRLGIVEGEDTEADARAALDHLATLTEPWLLVYDNVPNPDAVRKWLPTGAVRCIITSRHSQFGSLAPVTRLDQWSDAVTAEYLLSRTDRNDTSGAAELAKALGGLPLAAEQAAAFLAPRPGVSFVNYKTDIAKLIKRRHDTGLAGDYPDTVFAAFVKSLEALNEMESGNTALDILRICAFLSPDGIDLVLLTADSGGQLLPPAFSGAMADSDAREDALAMLVSLSLLRQEGGPFGTLLTFHRLLLEVVRDWMGDEARTNWGSVAVALIGWLFPTDANSNPGSWPMCARLVPHLTSLEAYAPRSAETGKALGYVLGLAGVFASVHGDAQAAMVFAEKAVGFTRTDESESLELAIALVNFAEALRGSSRLEAAEAALREALAIEERHLDEGNPSLAITINNLGTVVRERKDFPEAERLILHATEIIKDAFGPESGEYSTQLSNLGALYMSWADEPGDEWRLAMAEEYLKDEVEICRAARGTRHPDTATSYANLGALHARRADHAGVVTYAERSLAILLSLGLGQHPSTQQVAAELVAALEHQGQNQEAANLVAGMADDLRPTIARVESEHRAWVAEDPLRRHFGPPSYFTPTKENFEGLSSMLATAGVDLKVLFATKIPQDDFAKLVAETLARPAG